MSKCRWLKVMGRGMTHWYECEKRPDEYNDGQGCDQCPDYEPEKDADKGLTELAASKHKEKGKE